MAAEEIVGSLGIKIVPILSGFGAELQAGLAPFAGQSMSVGGGVQGAGARMAASSATMAPMTMGGTMAASAGAQAAAQQMNRAAEAGNWQAHASAADALVAAMSGVAGIPTQFGVSNFGRMSFYGGGTTGAFSSTGGGALSASSMRGDVRTEISQLSGSGQAEVAGIIKQETAAHQKLLSGIEKAAANMERIAIETANMEAAVRRGFSQDIHAGIQRSVGPGGLDPTNVIGGAIQTGNAYNAMRAQRRAEGTINRAIAAGGDFGMYDAPDVESLGDAERFAMAPQIPGSPDRLSGFSRYGPRAMSARFNRMIGPGARRAIGALSSIHLPPSARMVMFNAMFGGWEVAQAARATDEGDFNARMADSPLAGLQARIQGVEGGWAGPFGSAAAMFMSFSGSGPIPALNQMRASLSYGQEVEARRQGFLGRQYAPALNAAIASGNRMAAERIQIQQERDISISGLQDRLGQANTEIGSLESRTQIPLADYTQLMALRERAKRIKEEMNDLRETSGARTAAVDREIARNESNIIFDSNYSTQAGIFDLMGGSARDQGNAAMVRLFGQQSGMLANLPPGTSQSARTAMQRAFEVERGMLQKSITESVVAETVSRGAAAMSMQAGMGGLRSQGLQLQAMIGNNPLGAQLIGIESQRDRDIANIPTNQPEFMRRQQMADITRNARLTGELAMKDDAFQRGQIGLGQATERTQLQFLLGGNPIAAEAAGIAGAGISRANQLDKAGMRPLAIDEIKNSILSEEVVKKQYLDAFRGVSLDLRFNMPTGGQVADPGKELAGINEGIRQLNEKLSALTEN